MEASPAPMTILQASRVQKLLAKPQPTDDTMKMAIPTPVITLKLSLCCFELLMHAYIHHACIHAASYPLQRLDISKGTLQQYEIKI